MKKNVASQVVGAQMITASDGSAFTGTVSCAVTVDGGTQSAGGGTVTHEGNGFHSYTPTQAETNGDHVAFTFTGTGAIPTTVQVYTSFPQSADNLDAAGVRSAVGLASANLDTQLAALPTAAENRAEMDSNSTQLAAIVADTNELQSDDVPGLIAALDTVVDRVEADTQNIQSRLPASLNNGAIPADVQRINDAEITGDGAGTPFDVA